MKGIYRLYHQGILFLLVWNGQYFVRQEDRDFANPFLNRQLYEYSSMELALETERNNIRIDRMPDGTYRYAAWKADNAMSGVPELVINKGRRTNGESGVFIFNNNGYEYEVSSDEVVVRKGNGIIGQWKVVSTWNAG